MFGFHILAELWFFSYSNTWISLCLYVSEATCKLQRFKLHLNKKYQWIQLTFTSLNKKRSMPPALKYLKMRMFFILVKFLKRYIQPVMTSSHQTLLNSVYTIFSGSFPEGTACFSVLCKRFVRKAVSISYYRHKQSRYRPIEKKHLKIHAKYSIS